MRGTSPGFQDRHCIETRLALPDAAVELRLLHLDLEVSFPADRVGSGSAHAAFSSFDEAVISCNDRTP
jgi:hypothetical protein